MSSSSSEGEVELAKPKQVPDEEPVHVLTPKEMNVLASKILKAEMLGNVEQAQKLKDKLNKARAAAESAKASGGAGGEEERVVVLTRTDAKGMTRPIETASGGPTPASSGRRGKKGRVDTHGDDGKRKRYFADDDQFSLKQMFEREKLSTAEDQNAMLSRLAGKAIEKTNDDYDIDDVFTDRASKKQRDGREAERERERAIAEHQRMNRALEACNRCLGGRDMKKHLMIAMGEKCYLALPENASLAEGHCLIIPIGHASCATQLDEDVWNEIQLFRKTLVRMFREDPSEEDEPEDCVFFENAMQTRGGRHMVIECVPLPSSLGEVAPMYFQKAIQECESEWADNVKLVQLRDKGLRRSVPKGLPYFHVDFGTQDGFAHVIEDTNTFPKNFGHEILGGMLDVEPVIYRGHKRENFDVQKAKVLRFGARWKGFDFTKKNRDATSSSDSD